jgi:hypothetical protein
MQCRHDVMCRPGPRDSMTSLRSVQCFRAGTPLQRHRLKPVFPSSISPRIQARIAAIIFRTPRGKSQGRVSLAPRRHLQHLS